MARLVKLTRTLTYIGPEEWIRTTQAHSFVALARVLGPDRVIQSSWQEPSQDVSQEEMERVRAQAERTEQKQKEAHRG